MSHYDVRRVSMKTMISSSCKMSHRAKAFQNFLWDSTPDFISSQEWTPHSPDLNPLAYSVWDILQNLSLKEGANHLRISKIFRMLSETNGTMSMTRQSEKLGPYIAVEKAFSSCGKAELRTYSQFSTFSVDQLTDTNYCDVLRTTNSNSNNITCTGSTGLRRKFAFNFLIDFLCVSDKLLTYLSTWSNQVW